MPKHSSSGKRKTYEAAKLRRVEPSANRQADLLLYWTILLSLIILNFLAAAAMAPLMLLSKSVHVYFMVAAIGLLFGYVMSMLARSIRLEAHHHMVALVFVPLLAAFNLALMASSISGQAALLGMKAPDTITPSLVYALAFITPYAAYLRKRKR